MPLLSKKNLWSPKECSHVIIYIYIYISISVREQTKPEKERIYNIYIYIIIYIYYIIYIYILIYIFPYKSLSSHSPRARFTTACPVPSEGSAWHHSFPPFDLETLADAWLRERWRTGERGERLLRSHRNEHRFGCGQMRQRCCQSEDLKTQMSRRKVEKSPGFTPLGGEIWGSSIYSSAG